jgi:carbonic anhydrase/acetyltransferase-like protein (isoleucine patch superfamily)
MILEHRGARPTIDAAVRIAPNAVICGGVITGLNCSIGFGVVITAESGPVRVGSNCVTWTPL